jgi:hypothetical protein
MNDPFLINCLPSDVSDAACQFLWRYAKNEAKSERGSQSPFVAWLRDFAAEEDVLRLGGKGRKERPRLDMSGWTIEQIGEAVTVCITVMIADVEPSTTRFIEAVAIVASEYLGARLRQKQRNGE